MHDPVYPILNDRFAYCKNWLTDRYSLYVFSSNWPFRAIVNPDNIDEPLSEPLTANAACKSGDDIFVLNEYLTFNLVNQRCQENNSTFCEFDASQL